MTDYRGLTMWGGLWRRDPEIRTLYPLRGRRPSRSAPV